MQYKTDGESVYVTTEDASMRRMIEAFMGASYSKAKNHLRLPRTMGVLNELWDRAPEIRMSKEFMEDGYRLRDERRALLKQLADFPKGDDPDGLRPYQRADVNYLKHPNLESAGVFNEPRTGEQWKDVTGYEGLYQVSTLGRVKSVERTIYQYNPQLNTDVPIVYPKRYLKFEDNRGYSRVTLSKDNVQERFQVHQLVAAHFIPNPENKPCVNHINFDRKCNRVDNLEWVTHLENEDHKRSKQEKFRAISPSGDETIWYNRRACARELKLHRSGIERCLSGNQAHHRGYKFSYCPLDE